jgi:catechol 2,3-dioxygenase-like lactoylglutathione lyase family enzyme
MIRPTLNHLNLKTTRLKEMIDWYAAVTGGKIIFQSGESTKDNPIQIAFMSNDSAPFRIAFMGLPGLREDPEQFFHSGLHHMAFEYDSFDDLMSSFARLKQLGIEPIVCVQHGVTTSLFEAAKPASPSARLTRTKFYVPLLEYPRRSTVMIVVGPDCAPIGSHLRRYLASLSYCLNLGLAQLPDMVGEREELGKGEGVT